VSGVTFLDLKSQINNLLNLKAPETYSSALERFSPDHLVMWFRIYNHNKSPMNLVFKGVYFFDGPISWLGAEFCVASSKECLELVDKLGWIKGATEAEIRDFMEGFYLITVQAQNYKVRILVRGGYISEDVPPDFQVP